LYASDPHVAWCLQFYLDEARETRFRIVTGAEPSGELFLVAYRDPPAHNESLDRLAARGFRIDPVSRSGTAWQTAAVVAVWRSAGGEEAERPLSENQP
jgi:hypothetical protein